MIAAPSPAAYSAAIPATHDNAYKNISWRAYVELGGPSVGIPIVDVAPSWHQARSSRMPIIGQRAPCTAPAAKRTPCDLPVAKRNAPQAIKHPAFGKIGPPCESRFLARQRPKHCKKIQCNRLILVQIPNLIMVQRWQFERGDGRYKHRWQRDEAGFLDEAGAYVGKCHSSINLDVANALLNAGVVYHAPGCDTPEHVYVVYRGTIYEAAPTRPGQSFHGYPWRAGQGRPALPPRVLRRLRAMAEAEGTTREFDEWLKRYGL